MARMGLDLSKFKKVSGDQHKAILKHQDGHEMHISMKALSPRHRGDIAAMPIHKHESQAPKSPPQPMLADGGKVQKFAEGAEEIEPLPQELQDVPPLPANPPAPSSDPYAQMSQFQGKQEAPIPSGYKELEKFKPLAAASQAAPEEAPKAEDAAQSAVGEAESGQPPIPEAPIVPQQTALEAQEANPNAQLFTPGMQQQVHGAEMNVQAQEALGAQKAAAAQHAAAVENKLMQDTAAHTAAIQKEQDAYIQDIKNQHINPSQYMGNMDTVGKINTIVGLMAAGFGSGMQGRENPAISFLNNQIDRDISAQKANIDNKFNLVRAYSQQYGDTLSGELAAKGMMEAQVKNSIDAAEAKAIGPVAKAQLEQQKGVWANQMAMTNLKFGAVQAFYHSGDSEGPAHEAALDKIQQQMQIVDPKAAQEMQKHRIPGVGTSLQEIPQASRDQILNGKDTLQQLDAIRQFSQQHHGLSKISPLPADVALRAQGEVLTKNLLQSIRKENNMGVFKKASNEFEEGLTGVDPLGFMAKYTQEPKYKELATQAVREFNNLKESVGIHNKSAQSSPYDKPEASAQPKAPPGFRLVRTPDGKLHQVPIKK